MMLDDFVLRQSGTVSRQRDVIRAMKKVKTGKDESGNQYYLNVDNLEDFLWNKNSC